MAGMYVPPEIVAATLHPEMTSQNTKTVPDLQRQSPQRRRSETPPPRDVANVQPGGISRAAPRPRAAAARASGGAGGALLKLLGKYWRRWWKR